MKKMLLATMVLISSFFSSFFKVADKAENIDLVQKEKDSKPLGRTFDKV